MMRKFTEAAMGKEASFIDGVKIRNEDQSHMVMIPDQYAEYLHLYIQAQDEHTGEELLTHFAQKISQWSNE